MCSEVFNYAIFSIHYSQIENKVESEKHVKDFSLFAQIPHSGLARTWDGVCLNSVGCTRYFVGLICAV